jgi:hypothetical protein
VRTAADCSDCCLAWCADVYAYAATFTGGDAAATEALVERVWAQSFAPVASGVTVVLQRPELLADVRRTVLADVNSEHGEGRRLRLVLGADDAARAPRAGFVDSLVRRVEAGRLATTPPSRHRGRWVTGSIVIVVLALAVVAVSTRGHTGVRGGKATSSVRTLPVSLAAASDHENLKTTGSSVDAVRGYLVALSQQRWDVAADLLRGGAVPLDRRADLRPIFDRLADLPAALGEWCSQQAMCRAPDELVDNGNEVQATFVVEGETLHQSFGTGVYHGAAYVRGLPLRVPQPLRREQPWGLMLTLCPADNVVSVISADLDGDGWYEQVVLRNDGRSSGWTMTICGTYLTTRLVHLPPYPDLRVYPVHVGDRDVLLIGNEDANATFRGKVWSFEPGGGGAGFAAKDFVVTPSAGSNLGCLDVNGDGTPELVQLTVDLKGSVDVSDAQSFEYTATPVWPETAANTATNTVSGNVGLWPHSTSLPTEFAGYCGDRPIVVN